MVSRSVTEIPHPKRRLAARMDRCGQVTRRRAGREASVAAEPHQPARRDRVERRRRDAERRQRRRRRSTTLSRLEHQPLIARDRRAGQEAAQRDQRRRSGSGSSTHCGALRPIARGDPADQRAHRDDVGAAELKRLAASARGRQARAHRDCGDIGRHRPAGTSPSRAAPARHRQQPAIIAAKRFTNWSSRPEQQPRDGGSSRREGGAHRGLARCLGRGHKRRAIRHRRRSPRYGPARFEARGSFAASATLPRPGHGQHRSRP